MPDLNMLLKQNQMDLKEDDQADFEVFLAKLHQKRKHDEHQNNEPISSYKKEESDEEPTYKTEKLERHIPEPNDQRDNYKAATNHDPFDNVKNSQRSDYRNMEENDNSNKESSEDDDQQMTKAQKQELKQLDDQIESLLKVNTGNLFGQTQIPSSAMNLKRDDKKPEIKKEPTVSQTNRIAENSKNKKYEDFMKYMEDIEEEISGQCERSAQRRKKDQDDLDDIISRSINRESDKEKQEPKPIRELTGKTSKTMELLEKIHGKDINIDYR